MAIYDNQDDALDRSSFLMSDHDNYNLYAIDWSENVFAEEIPVDELEADDTTIKP
jgi:hypothetical protein